jgi:antitoxin VapB
MYGDLRLWAQRTARVFRSGKSHAARLPKQYRLNSEEVEIFRRGDEIILREKDGTTVRAFDLLADLPDDFHLTAAEREKNRPQKRKWAVMEPRYMLDTNICIYIRQKGPRRVCGDSASSVQRKQCFLTFRTGR